jgi:hypothetical protein
MFVRVRIRGRAPLKGVLSAGLASAALLIAPGHAFASGFGVSLWEAGTCVNKTCTYESVKKNHAEAFTQADGHPPWGGTTFELNSKPTILKQQEPEGEALKRVRVDVAGGLASNPQAPPKCAIKAFKEDKCAKETEVGTNELTVFAKGVNVSVEGPVYNLEPELAEEGLGGLPLLFGIHVEIPAVANEHVYLKGYVSWFSDYHEYFEIDNINKENKVLKSKLNFNGRAGGDFITLPSECSPTSTSYLEVESWNGEGRGIKTATTPPLGVEGCENPQLHFEPAAAVSGETTQSDEPDGASTEVDVKQNAGPEELNTPDVKDAHVTLPEGLTLNPAAVRGLEACTPEQIGIGTQNPVACPAGSKVGTVEIEADLPKGALKGNVYLGAPAGTPITGPPYTIYVDAEAPAYGVSVRREGIVNPNPSTGRLETTFLANPQQPFSKFTLKVNGGPLAPLANPLSCEAGQLEALFTPYGGGALWPSVSGFAATGCPSPLPFSLTASTPHAPTQAGAQTAYTFNLAREDGQQYVSHVSTTLPAGLVGNIPAVERCGEPQAAAGTCAATSRIGTATVTVGAGAEPYAFSGPVYLTGPYGGAPFGLSIAVPAVAGPFNLGTVVTRATVSVDPSTARVTVASSLPTIVAGVPLRIRTISVAVERVGFLVNPTNCAEQATETSLGSTLGASLKLSTPFATTGCGSLGFAPTFTAATDAHATKAGGMSLKTTVAQGAGQSNIRSVTVQLPKQASTRLTTIQQACPEATAAAGLSGCPAGSVVGSATATTPTLPGVMSGPAYLVSHASEAFPDLDIVLEGSGVRVVLVGNTKILGGATTTTFATLPDVPVSSFSLDLPTGPHSAFAANSDLCAAPLVMPTTFIAQSGAEVHQNTHVSVAGCGEKGGAGKGLRIVSRRIRRHTLVLVVQTSAAGRLTVRGTYLRSYSRRLRAPARTTIKIPLTRRALAVLRSHHRLKIRARVTLSPARGGASAAAATTVTFRH